MRGSRRCVSPRSRRVDVDVVEGDSRLLGKVGEPVLLDHGPPIPKAGGGQVLAHGARRGGGLVDEDSRLRTSTERFDPDTARPGEQVEEETPFDVGAKDSEETLLDTIANRPRPIPGNAAQLATACASADDPPGGHAPSVRSPRAV